MTMESLRRNFMLTDITDALSEAVRELCGHTCHRPPASSDELRHYFREGKRDPSSVYKRNLAAYTQRYVLANLAKNLYLHRRLEAAGLLTKCKRILDIGCGPGTFAIAHMLWDNNSPGESPRDCHIKMVDAVSEFLDIFQHLQKTIENRWGCSRIKQEVIHAFVDGSIGQFYEDADLIILSNSIIEILRNHQVDSKRFLHDLGTSNAIIAIVDFEYEDSLPYFVQMAKTLEHSHSCLGALGNEHRSRWPMQKLRLGTVGEIFGEEMMSVETRAANVEFVMSIWVPKSKTECVEMNLANRIVSLYKRAWERHDVAILRDLFMGDAPYTEKEGEQPLKGIREICDYWKSNSEYQRSVCFEPVSINYQRGKVIADWRCSFYRCDLKKWMFLKGLFEAEVRGSRISHFTECFEKQIIEFHEPLTNADRQSLAMR